MRWKCTRGRSITNKPIPTNDPKTMIWWKVLVWFVVRKHSNLLREAPTDIKVAPSLDGEMHRGNRKPPLGLRPRGLFNFPCARGFLINKKGWEREREREREPFVLRWINRFSFGRESESAPPFPALPFSAVLPLTCPLSLTAIQFWIIQKQTHMF